jgi:hypothetical protein
VIFFAGDPDEVISDYAVVSDRLFVRFLHLRNPVSAEDRRACEPYPPALGSAFQMSFLPVFSEVQ